MQINSRLLITFAFSLFTVAGPATATTIESTSYANWVASLNGSPTEGFSYVASGSYSTPTGWSTTIGNYGTFSVTGPDGSGYSLSQTFYGSNSALVGASDGTGGVAVTDLSGGVTGILLGVGETGNSAPVSVVLSDGESFSISPGSGGNTLIGFSTSAPITSVYLSTSNGSAVVLDDLYAGVSNLPAGAETPATECATILLISGGLLFLGAKRKIFSNLTSARTETRAPSRPFQERAPEGGSVELAA